MTKITTRLIVIGILTAVFVGVMIVSVVFINQRSLNDGYLINIAGQERMLTQKIAKEVFMINSQNSNDFTHLNVALKEFEANLNILRFGDKEKNLKPPNRAIISRQLDSIFAKWVHFRSSIEDFKTLSNELYDNKHFLEANYSKILKLSDDIVKEMVQTKVSPVLIDVAGNQRMLIQRMAYFLIHYANWWDLVSYDEFKESYQKYDHTLVEFYHNLAFKQSPKLFQNIKETYEFWQIYKQHIQEILAKQEKIVEDLKSIADNNTEILNELDWVVNLYADISIHSRSYLEKFQYVAAFILCFLALYAIKNVLSINTQLKKFVRKTQILAQAEAQENLATMIELEGESELSLASQNLSKFLHKIDITKETSKRARELSEAISEEVANISEEILAKLEMTALSEAKKKSILKAINLSEDIATQSSEQLIVAARLLEKLHKILKEIKLVEKF
ncbi:type IV pili methyl-accepting chemotaxis transducer N-terminal domain-containing protein [Helicobacter mesocricetorum]|uniref:type IV pili methyl-accepting chemotaxis transducer N-terminal domain-containing protein n=1 Tax=Helicobacter mesocricetorum TaxID=87012 RepID=UPI000CF1A6D7|nr:type IV pili methyl-accepting chemotaxis transducer N-terminal domain-containing protein [Helicobacter mesocricetorum]